MSRDTAAIVKVARLGLGDATRHGSFYATVDGHAVGDAGRAFWETREQAQACGDRYAEGIVNRRHGA